MDVSVIIPLYNLEKYIEKSIKSVLEQDFDGEYEVIVVDDGSKDNSFMVVENLCKNDSRIKLIHQENSGVSTARNKGIEAASGKYIVFVDGDDVLFSDALKTFVESIENTPNAILSCGIHERITSYEQERTPKDGCVKQSRTKEILKEFLTENYDVSACAKMFIKEKIGTIRFTDGKKINEDKYFLFQYLTRNNGIVLDLNTVVYGYYVREGSATNSDFSSGTLDMLYFSKKIEEDIKLNLPDFVLYARCNNLVTHLAVLKKIVRSRCYRTHKKLLKSLRKETLGLFDKATKRKIKTHKVELITLQISSFLYILCVKMFDFIKNIKESTNGK